MVLTDAKKLVGQICDIRWLNRCGEEIRAVSRIHDATFVPMYGGYLITDTEDVRLDRIIHIQIVADDGSRTGVFANELAVAA